MRALLAALLAITLPRARLALPPLRGDDRSAYVTLINTDDYADGTAALALSLAWSGCRRPLVVLLGPLVSDATAERLATLGLTVQRISKATFVTEAVAQRNRSEGYGHWINTFDKLAIFAITRFEKIVFLDSDMLVLECLDQLFDRPHLSAVSAGRSIPGNADWTRLNSGLLVIEPSEAHAATVASALGVFMAEDRGSDGAVGDQDVINHAYPDWPDRKSLHLSERFNVLSEYVDLYHRILRQEGGIAVVHFAGRRKPWQATGVEILRASLWYIRKGEPRAALALLAYRSFIAKARLMVRH